MLSVTDGLSGVGPPPTLTMSHAFAILDVPRRAYAQNATPKDRFVKSSRSFDVGDGEKVCDAKSILRRHVITFLLDLYLVHKRLQFRSLWYYFSVCQEYVGQCALATNRDLLVTAKTRSLTNKKKDCGHSPGRT